MKIVIAQVLLDNSIFKDLHVARQGVSATGWRPAFRHALGKYVLPVGNVEMTVLMQNGHLALEMPNKIIIELSLPDNKGKWYFTIDDKTSVSFEKDDTGKVKAMKLHQVFELPKNK